MMTHEEEEKLSSKITAEIALASTKLAATRTGATQATSAIIECAVAALSPIVSQMFEGGTMQERLLFSLVLAGACSTLSEDKDGFGLTVEISPKILAEAFDVYSRLTGKDIKPFLPKNMVRFASGHSQQGLH